MFCGLQSEVIYAAANKYLIPIHYADALAFNESGCNPNTVNPISNATGLFQIVRVALNHYNEVNGTAYKLEDCIDPAISAEIGLWLIGLITRTWQQRGLVEPDWRNEAYLTLVTWGWNAGWSGGDRQNVGRGVGYVIREAKNRGLNPLDIDLMYEFVQTLRLAASTLKDSHKQRWAKKVARDAIRNLGETPAPNTTSNPLIAFLNAIGEFLHRIFS